MPANNRAQAARHRHGPPLRATVAVDPFLLRSSLHALLAMDGRFDAKLCPMDQDPLEVATRNDSEILIVSDPVSPQNGCVIVVLEPDNRLHFTYRTSQRQATYQDMADLIDTVAGTATTLLHHRHAG